MQQKTILVTGGAGYIGSHSAWLLAKQGYKVVIIDRMLYGQQPTWPWATIIAGDIGNKELLCDIFQTYQIDAVMHFAAFIEVGASVVDPRTYYANNVANTLTLLETMLTYGVKQLVFSSSCAVYGEPYYLPIDEQHQKQPMSPYGKTKLIVEQMLEDFDRAYGIRSMCLRYFNAAGAQPHEGLGEMHEPETHIIPLIFRAMQEGKPFVVFGNDYDTQDGTCVRDYVHVSDIANAHLLALHHLQKGNPSDQFNLGTGRGYSIKELIDTAQQVCNMPLRVLYGKRRAGDPARLVACPAKAAALLGWKPCYSELAYIVRSAHAFSIQQKEQQALCVHHL